MLGSRIGERDYVRVRVRLTMCYRICKSLLYQIVLIRCKILGKCFDGKIT